jgi:hypothetical protein
MNWIRRNPVAALTTLYTVLAAVYGVIASTELLPDRVVASVGIGVAILAAILGALTHTKVTPLANPKNSDGVPLVALRPGGRVK